MAGAEGHAMLGAPDGAEEHAAVRGTVASTRCRATADAEGRAMVDEDGVSADERAKPQSQGGRRAARRGRRGRGGRGGARRSRRSRGTHRCAPRRRGRGGRS
jgi:hypothetical protein